MGLAKIRFHGTTLLTILAFPTKGGGQVCEKAVFVKVSNLYYITLPIKAFWKRLAHEFGVAPFPTGGRLAWNHAQADKVALRA